MATMSRTSTSNESLSEQYVRAQKFFKNVLLLVVVYASGMVTAGRSFAVPFFDLLNFGPNARGVSADGVNYTIFAFGVLGAVLIGWMALFWGTIGLAVHHDPDVRSKARHALTASIAIWFVTDTGFSLVMGEIEHAAFNLPFLTLLSVPIYIMSTNDSSRQKKSN